MSSNTAWKLVLYLTRCCVCFRALRSEPHQPVVSLARSLWQRKKVRDDDDTGHFPLSLLNNLHEAIVR